MTELRGITAIVLVLLAAAAVGLSCLFAAIAVALDSAIVTFGEFYLFILAAWAIAGVAAFGAVRLAFRPLDRRISGLPGYIGKCLKAARDWVEDCIQERKLEKP